MDMKRLEEIETAYPHMPPQALRDLCGLLISELRRLQLPEDAEKVVEDALYQAQVAGFTNDPISEALALIPPALARNKVLETETRAMAQEINGLITQRDSALARVAELEAENAKLRAEAAPDREALKVLNQVSQFLVARDEMNSFIHLSPVRMSPLTTAVKDVIASLTHAKEDRDGRG